MGKSLVTGSIVTYHNSKKDIKNVIDCFLGFGVDIILFIVDNSSENSLSEICNNPRIQYVFNNSNPGFGAAHNIAIQKAIELDSHYHFIVNPDIYFEGDVISPMIDYMKSDTSIGMMMPEILNLDGTIQNLPRLLPSPLSILRRKIIRPTEAYQKFINKYELREVPKGAIYNAPVISGCFTLLNLGAIKKVGMYDDTFFMYFEDWDLCRRMHKEYKTIYFPYVSVYHGYDSGANKNWKLFMVYIISMITYFNKWGWFFDAERKRMNNEALSQFN